MSRYHAIGSLRSWPPADSSLTNQHEPAFFSWLGVTQYLTREAVLSTLQYVASWALGSEIVQVKGTE
jgi:O-methyltransferase involved in polyketide biosynthesis